MHNSKTKWLISLVALVSLFAVAGGVNAQSNVIAALSVGSDAITVGDVIPLTLQVTHPAGWRVIAPALEKKWGDFEVRSQAAPSITANGDGTETTVQKIEAVRMRPGEVQTPALMLSIADDRGNLQNVEVAPVSVMVQSVLVAGNTQLRDLKPQADLITFQRTYAPVVAVVALILAVLAVYAIRRWRHRPVVDKRTPRERALDILKTVTAQNPPTPENLTAACVEIAACLREYIAATTPILARDLTTNELARQMKQNEVPAEWSTQVVEVLRVCDSVKFARDVLELTTIQDLVDTAERLVRQYPPEPAPSATPKTERARVKGAIA